MSLDTEQDAGRRAGLAVLAAFALVSVVLTGFFSPFTNPNELSRFESVYSFVETGSLSIDGAIRVFGDHEDKAFSGGRFYSNKAPGLAFAAIPVYRTLRLFLPAPRSLFEPIFVLTRLGTVTLVCLLAIAAALRRLRPSPEGPLVVFALVFGTPFLFYGRTIFGHAWTAALLLLSWEALRRGEEKGGRRQALQDAAAGFLAGWAAISEYTAAPIAVLLALRATRRSPATRLAFFSIGAAVPLLLLLFYDNACFGSPWVLSAAREAEPEYVTVSRTGLFGFGPPSLSIAGKYLIDGARGLLWRSPFWLWIVPGFLAWWRSKKDRADFAFALVSMAGFFLLLTGYQNWHGGWSLGNRYLLPVIFFAAPALERALEPRLSRGLFCLAAVYSAAAHSLLASSFPYFPPGIRHPARSATLWFLRNGWIAPSTIAPDGVAFFLVLLAVAAACLLALRAARPATPGPAVAAAGALSVLAVSLAAAPEPSYSARLWRSAVYGTFSGLDHERRELRSVVLEAATDAQKREAIGAWTQYGPRNPSR